MYGQDSLIKMIYENDKNKEFIKLIQKIYGISLYSKRLQIYRYSKKKKFLNEHYKELEIFFHDLRNEFAHLIEEEKSKAFPLNELKEFSCVAFKVCKNIFYLKKEQIIKFVELIDKFLR